MYDPYVSPFFLLPFSGIHSGGAGYPLRSPVPRPGERTNVPVGEQGDSEISGERISDLEKTPYSGDTTKGTFPDSAPCRSTV